VFSSETEKKVIQVSERARSVGRIISGLEGGELKSFLIERKCERECIKLNFLP